MKIFAAPSLLACDIMNLASEIRRAEAAGADILHLDIMDGVYVPNMSFGFGFVKAVSSFSKLPADVHMMTVCPGKYIDSLKDAGAWGVTVHHDIAPRDEIIKILSDIRKNGMRASVALRPAFPASDIEPFLPYIDMALVMTVEPGFGGQRFMPDMLEKISEIRRMAPSLDIQVDGGITCETASLCAAAGANVFVAGTSLFKSDDMALETAKMKKAAEDARKY